MSIDFCPFHIEKQEFDKNQHDLRELERQILQSEGKLSFRVTPTKKVDIHLLFYYIPQKQRRIVKKLKYPSIDLKKFNIFGLDPFDQHLNQIVPISDGSCEIKDVIVSLSGSHIDWIHTYKFDTCISKGEIKPILVMIHPYGTGSFTYFKMFKTLKDHFQIFCMDIIGMGLSSRPCLNHLQDPVEIINFLVKSVEIWIEQIGLSDKKFFLLGCSFGGYLASQYTLRNSQRIRKLFLIASIGICNKDKDKNKQQKQVKGDWRRQVFRKIENLIWQSQLPFEDVAKKWFIPISFIISQFLVPKLRVSSDLEKIINKFLLLFVKQSPGSTPFLYRLFLPNQIHGIIPMENFFEKSEFNVPIHFIEGEYDWVSIQGSERLCQNNPFLFTKKKILNVDHWMTVQEPNLVCQEVIQNAFLHKENKIDDYNLVKNIQDEKIV